MSVHKVKLLAAGVLAACGLAVSGGAGWVATAGAQNAPAKVAPGDRVKQLEAELQRARAEAEQAAAEAARAEALKKVAEAKAKADEAIAKRYIEKDKPTKSSKADATNTTKQNDYLFVAVSPMDQPKFMEFLQKHEDKGWVYCGTTPMDDKPVWVFRKPKGGLTYTLPDQSDYNLFKYPGEPKPATAKPVESTRPAYPVPPAPPAPPAAPAAPQTPTPIAPLATAPPAQSKPADTVEVIEAEIQRLQEKLEVLKKSKPKK